MSLGRRQLSFEAIAVFAIGAIILAVAAGICATAYRSGEAPARPAPDIAALSPAPPPALPPAAVAAAPAPAVLAPPPVFGPPSLDLRSPPPSRATSPSIALAPSAPFPPPRPIEINPPARRPGLAGPGPSPGALSRYDRFTAVYDIASHTVFLPDGERLEAHSGLGPLRDDPAHVDEKDRGATPPHLYDLALREDLFHGVQAVRLHPVGGASEIFGRDGLLAHTYMLGPNGDSNGCVSFKNYAAFLQAFQSGQIKRLAVVSSLK
jgi:hypothetical protein